MGCTSSNDASSMKPQLMGREEITKFKNMMDSDDMNEWTATLKKTADEMGTYATMKPEEKKIANDECKARAK